LKPCPVGRPPQELELVEMGRRNGRYVKVIVTLL
jgi:hypothetical protein